MVASTREEVIGGIVAKMRKNISCIREKVGAK